MKFALCIDDADCDDLEKRKLYQILPDEEATQEGYLRVVDESGEGYLYPNLTSYLSNCLSVRKKCWQPQLKIGLAQLNT